MGRVSHSVSGLGQALVEFTLVIFTLMLILLGIFEFGRAVASYTEIHNAAREGARYYSVHEGDATGAETAALARIVLAQGAEVTIADDGQIVTVAVDHDFAAVVAPIFRIIGGDGTIHLRSVSKMRLEGAEK